MNEIGGYFSLEQLKSDEYHKGLTALNTARNCLLYLLKARKITQIYIPYYNCDSISDMCRRNGYEYEYYHIDADFLPLFAKQLSAEQYLYVINYYGRLSDETIAGLKEKYKNIILDNAQAFFRRPLPGIDTFYSCRKFFGVPDGGYLSSDIRLEEELETDKSAQRMKHLLGRYEESAAKYYSDFVRNDEAFQGEPMKKMSGLTRNLLGAIDYDRAYRIRNQNYRFLAEQLDGVNELKAVEPDGAFAYPFYTKKAAKIKKALLPKKIYIATLWPNVLAQMPCESVEYHYSECILPLPCDQRYTTNDMEYIAKELKQVYEGQSECANLSRRL